jgi:hypothetical protein
MCECVCVYVYVCMSGIHIHTHILCISMCVYVHVRAWSVCVHVSLMWWYTWKQYQIVRIHVCVRIHTINNHMCTHACLQICMCMRACGLYVCMCPLCDDTYENSTKVYVYMYVCAYIQYTITCVRMHSYKYIMCAHTHNNQSHVYVWYLQIYHVWIYTKIMYACMQLWNMYMCILINLME